MIVYMTLVISDIRMMRNYYSTIILHIHNFSGHDLPSISVLLHNNKN